MTHHRKELAHDPAGDYNEWIRNRYNPGYYLGGRISPLMRASQSMFTAPEKRLGAVMFVIWIVLVIAGALWAMLR